MRIFSALLFLFLSFVSLSVISAVPEEEKKGIVARFRQMRGKGFYLSKFLVLLFLSLVFLALSLLLLHETLSLSSESLLWFSIYYLFSLLSFYFFFWGIFSMIRDERLGKNLSICVIFLILLFSGRLFSAGKIPFSIAQFSPVSITALILEGDIEERLCFLLRTRYLFRHVSELCFYYSENSSIRRIPSDKKRKRLPWLGVHICKVVARALLCDISPFRYGEALL